MALAVWRGQDRTALELIEASKDEIVAGGQGLGLTLTQLGAAALHNSRGRYADALRSAKQAVEDPNDLWFSGWALIELIEAGTRTGDLAAATDALERLAQRTRPSGSDWARASEARSRALLSEGDAAEALHREAIERYDRTRLRGERARARLVFGEWLRGKHRRTESRQHLGAAYEIFVSMGAEAFAERARVGLLATGEPSASEASRRAMMN